MPSSFMRTFTDPDELSEATRGAAVQFTVTQRGIYTAKLTFIDLGNFWLQNLSGDLTRNFQIEFLQPIFNITLQTKPGPSQVRNGTEYGINDISRSDCGHYDRSSGPASTGSVSIPVNEMTSLSGVLLGHDYTPSKDPQTITPPRDAMARLQRLYGAALSLAEDAPEIIANPDAARGLGQTLIEAVIDCLRHGQQQRDNTLAQGQHTIVMRRFHRMLEENPEQPLFIPEICKAIRVSELADLLPGAFGDEP